MTITPEARATNAPAPGRRVTPTGCLILPADADRDAWLNARRNGIGSSDMAAILGISRYGNALRVYHDKTGGLPLDGDDSEPALWGRAIEDTVAREWARRNRSVVRRIGLVANVDRPWQMCTLDRRVLECPISAETRERCAVEIKCRDKMKAGMWRKGTPDDVLAQVLWQIDTCGFEHLHVATLIGGNDYRQFTVFRKDYEDLIGDLRAAGAAAWEQITTRQPPALTGAEDPRTAIELYEDLYPEREGVPVIVDRDLDTLDALADYLDASSDEREAKNRKDRAKAVLLGALGQADHAVRDDRVLFSYDETSREWCNTKRLAEEYPDAYTACVEDRPSRRLNIPRYVRQEHTA